MYGLKAKVREIVLAMNAIRGHQKTPRDITLGTYIAENFKDGNSKPLSANHLFAECGVNVRSTTVDELMADEDNKHLLSELIRESVRRGMGVSQREAMRAASLGPGVFDGGNERFMSREVFLDPVMRGAVQAAFYNDLIVREESVSQPTVTVPTIEISDANLKDSAEAATIEEGTVSYGSKNVTLTKKARGFKVTYEAIRYNSLSLASLFFEDAGRILGHTLNSMAVNTIVDGDQGDGSEAIDTIGVTDTNDGAAWIDLTRVAIRLNLLGRLGTQILANSQEALDFLNLEEVKNRQFGNPLLATVLASPLTMPERLYVSNELAANMVVINDPSCSLVQLTSAPLMVETEKIISKQIEAAYVSITTGFAKLQRNASVQIDGGTAYVADTASDFSSWMAPYSE